MILKKNSSLHILSPLLAFLIITQVFSSVQGNIFFNTISKNFGTNTLRVSDLKKVESDDTFIPYVVRQVEPSIPPNPDGVCKFPFASGGFNFSPRSSTIRRIISVRSLRKSVFFTATIDGNNKISITLKIVQTNRYRFKRVGVKLFLDRNAVSVSKRRLRPFTSYRSERRPVFSHSEVYELSSYKIPRSLNSCCNSRITIGFFMSICKKRKSSDCIKGVNVVRFRLPCSKNRI